MITGAIDYVAPLGDGRVLLSGWARHVSVDAARPVDGFTLAGLVDVVISVTERDISGTSGCGFKLVLPSAEVLAALYWNGISLYALAGSESLTLDFWDRIKEKVVEIIVSYLVQSLGGKEDLLAALRDANKATRNREEVRRFLDEAAASSAIDSVLVQRGAASHDSEITLGRDGFLFLLGGSNGLLQQYRYSEDAEAVERWVALIRVRQDYCISRGIVFRQMIVPEKQSVIPEFFPVPLEVPTKLFAAITRALRAEPFFIDCAKILRDLFVFGGLQPFRKVDSHLNYFGAEALVREFMRGFGIQADIFAKTLRQETSGGDLGSKFFQGNIFERLLVPAENWEFAREAPDLVRAEMPVDGHMGTVMEWRARKPISHQTLLIFGNSMFERGGSPMSLSWWLSRIFERTRFVWSADIKYEHVDDLQPSLIICQTVERFLPTLPKQ